MSAVEIGDMWTTMTGPEHPAEIVTGIEGEHARFASGGFWRVDRLTAELGWKRIRPAREAAYEARILELQDAVERTARSGVENATRYAADIDKERRAEAAAVERIRAAIVAGASDAEQAHVLEVATKQVETLPPEWSMTRAARAYLALSASHAEARALLSDIGNRALALLGKATT